jgi:dipeptidase
MCDTACAVRTSGTLFAKSSDRPITERQVLEALPARPAGGRLATTYLEIDDAGASAILGSRPAWMWGLEHGVNEHGVAIGNERVYTALDAGSQPTALLGMDLLRLGLERGRTADGALEVITALLERHGQGGIADDVDHEAYFSSFLVADGTGAWVLETSGRSWAARPIPRGTGAAISNRLALGAEFTRSSTDVVTGRGFAEQYQDPEAWVAHADRRLDATMPGIAARPDRVTPADAVAVLRHHGDRPWGRPGEDTTDVSPVPHHHIGADGTGVSVCMHIRGYQATAASMIAELPADAAAPVRAWVSLGSPCTGVFLPVFPPLGAPPAWAQTATADRFARLSRSVEGADEEAATARLTEIRALLGPLESELWAEAEAIDAHDPEAVSSFLDDATRRVDEALSALEA